MNIKKIPNMPNPFGIEVSDDLNTLSKLDIKQLGLMILDNLLVICRSQEITPRKFASLCYSWGYPETLNMNTDVFSEELKQKATENFYEELKKLCLTKLPGVIKLGTNGILPYGELDWHSDYRCGDAAKHAIALYAYNINENCTTQFYEGVTPYHSLSVENRQVLDELEYIPSFKSYIFPDKYSQEQLDIINFISFDGKTQSFPLVVTSPGGHRGILYNRMAFNGFKNKTKKENDELIRWIESILFKPEHVYTHEWHKGDFLIMDQTVMMHRRPDQDFSNRHMYRMLFDLSKLISL